MISGFNYKMALRRATTQAPVRLSHGTAAGSEEEEYLTAYRWKPNVSLPPAHGDSADPNNLLETFHGGISFEKAKDVSSTSSNSMDIDQVHRLGLPHMGVWVFAVDNQQRLMLLKRGHELVTCPNSWSLVGEHCSRGEEHQPERTVLRGLSEEVGAFLLKNIKRQHNLVSNGLPIYYFRDYGHTMDNRKDKQLTYFWFVEFNVPGEAISRQWQERWQQQGRLSDSGVSKKHEPENTEIKWVTVQELEKWISDQPGDFCHSTLVKFFQIGLRQLKRVLPLAT